MEIRFYDQMEEPHFTYAVIAAWHKGCWIYCRHRRRTTWEIPGGHWESGEDIRETAERELYEETGALDYSLYPVGVYSVVEERGEGKIETFGMLYFSIVNALESLPDSEIGEIIFSKDLPKHLTYPEIQPLLLEHAERFAKEMGLIKKEETE